MDITHHIPQLAGSRDQVHGLMEGTTTVAWLGAGRSSPCLSARHRSQTAWWGPSPQRRKLSR